LAVHDALPILPAALLGLADLLLATREDGIVGAAECIARISDRLDRLLGRGGLAAQILEELLRGRLEGDGIQRRERLDGGGIRDDLLFGDAGLLRHARELRDLRSEEHTSELQSRENLVCRLLLEKKKQYRITHTTTH